MTDWPSVSEIASGVKKGQLRASELVKESLKLIADNKEFESVISVIENRALERAKQIDESSQKGQNVGPLAGVPFIAKDNFLTFGTKTTAAAKYLKSFEAPYQATAI